MHMPYGKLIVQVPCTYAKLVNLVSRLLSRNGMDDRRRCTHHFTDALQTSQMYLDFHRNFLTPAANTREPPPR